jgi:hypothetical protein
MTAHDRELIRRLADLSSRIAALAVASQGRASRRPGVVGDGALRLWPQICLAMLHAEIEFTEDEIAAK